MESGLERLIAERAEAFAEIRWAAILEDLPDDVQDELLEEAEEAIRDEIEAARDREIGSRIGRYLEVDASEDA